MVVSRAELLEYDVYKRRRLQTRAQMLRRLLIFVIVVVGIGVVLMAFQPVRQIGTGLLASAGIAGVIAGLAAQKSLSTIIAGLQIAITQPMRIEDVVIVEGEWGTIEEITLTYVVIRVWDRRRLIVPINYFLEKPFQNWTRSSSDLMGAVFLYVDFLIPVEKVREETKRIVEASKLWDKRVFAFQVTDFRVRLRRDSYPGQCRNFAGTLRPPLRNSGKDSFVAPRSISERIPTSSDSAFASAWEQSEQLRWSLRPRQWLLSRGSLHTGARPGARPYHWSCKIYKPRSAVVPHLPLKIISFSGFRGRRAMSRCASSWGRSLRSPA